jgi:hypothetical protein
MSEKRTKADILEELSVVMAEELLARIQTGAATPADLSVARALLKDNNIIVNAESDHPATKLAVVLPFEDKKTAQG